MNSYSSLSLEDLLKELESRTFSDIRDGYDIGDYDSEDLCKEAAARLRNSIPKPVVDVEADLDNHEYWIRVNDTPFRVYNFQRTANLQATALRTALGINDTEGGV